jgi:hypothetical protein
MRKHFCNEANVASNTIFFSFLFFLSPFLFPKRRIAMKSEPSDASYFGCLRVLAAVDTREEYERLPQCG